MKCQYLDELTGGKGIVFATGTPVSNSMTELYTMMKYLQYDKLMDMGFRHFDSWAAQYGETKTAIELAPEGTGYRARTRFARFNNLPELMNHFKAVSYTHLVGQNNHFYYSEKGLTVARGDVSNPIQETTLSWPKVQARVLKLMNDGLFLGTLEQVEYQEWKKDKDGPAQVDESPQSPAAETAPEQQAVEAPTPPQAVADEPQGREYAVGDTVYPVSYTHLDVYKRQTMSYGLLCRKAISGRLK